MKVVVGFDNTQYGFIESTPSGLRLSGDNLMALQNVVSDMQGDLSDDEFLRSLPDRLRSRVWALAID